MASIQGHDDLRSESFGERDDRGVRAAERKVLVGFDELRDPRPVLRRRRLHLEVLEAAEKAGLCLGSESTSDYVGHLGHDEGRNDELKVGALQRRERALVVLVVDVCDRVERAGVNDGEHESTRRRESPRGRARSYGARWRRARRTGPAAARRRRARGARRAPLASLARPTAADGAPRARAPQQAHPEGKRWCASYAHTSIT